MNPTDGQKLVMELGGHLLVIGGPGSGKTTISILKAAQLAKEHLRPGQNILFLSFARATVSRVIEAIAHEHRIPDEQRQRIDVDTYHAFFWQILKTHGYLIGLPRRLSVLTPQMEAIALSVIRSGYPAKNLTSDQKLARADAVKAEQVRLAMAEGRVCFDLYALYAGELLKRSQKVRRLISTMFPVVVLDEFQDTNSAQWEVVKALGEHSRLIALADPEQRIFEWIGADPERLDHFQGEFNPTLIDLSSENHRSRGTEIADFANEILAGQLKKTDYIGVTVKVFDSIPAQAMTKLVTSTYSARNRLIKSGKKDWSLAILVPTKKLTRQVSDAFREPPAGMAQIAHTAVVELDAAILAADLLAHLLQPGEGHSHFSQFVDLLCAYYQGKGGDEPTRTALGEASNLKRSFIDTQVRVAKGNAPRARSVLSTVRMVYDEARKVQLTGAADKDWYAVRSVLQKGACSRLNEVASEARNLRILERGAQFRQALTQAWLDHGEYRNALEITRQAFVQEHFSKGTKPEIGVVVMNMHKAKGKQFDEVIMFEGVPVISRGTIMSNQDRFVRGNLVENIDSQNRQNFRVSVTRAKKRTTILTPREDLCVLISTALPNAE